MGEPRNFYYPLQDESVDIDRVIHDLVEITDDESSVNNFVKVINVEGQPHFSYGPVEDKDIKIDEWEIPVGDGNDWVRKSDFYATVHYEPFRNTTLFGSGYHSWMYPKYQPVAKNFTFSGATYHLSKCWLINTIFINEEQIVSSFDTFQEFNILVNKLISFPNQVSLSKNLFVFDETLADRPCFNSSYNSVPVDDESMVHCGLALRSKEDSSIVGLILFSKNGEISLYYDEDNTHIGNNAKCKIQSYYNGQKIDSSGFIIDGFSLGRQVGIDKEQFAIYDRMQGKLTIDYTIEAPVEMAFGTRVPSESLFLGFDVGNQAKRNASPYRGGIMIKDPKSTLWTEGNSLLFLKNEAVARLDGACLNMVGASESVPYEGLGHRFNISPKVWMDGTTGATPTGPHMQMFGISSIQFSGKSAFQMSEGSGLILSGRSWVGIHGYSIISITGAPMIVINGNACPGHIKFEVSFVAQNDSTHTATFQIYCTPTYDEIYTIRNLYIGKKYVYNTIMSLYTENKPYYDYCYYSSNIDKNEENDAKVTSFNIIEDDCRRNGTTGGDFSLAERIGDWKNFTNEGVLPGNRQAAIVINGGSSIALNPNDYSDPIVALNGAASIVMNNEGPTLSDGEHVVTDLTKSGRGPLILTNENQFLFSGYGSWGASGSGCGVGPSVKLEPEDFSLSHLDNIRDKDLEELLRIVKNQGYIPFSSETVTKLASTISKGGCSNPMTCIILLPSSASPEKIQLTSNFYTYLEKYYAEEYDRSQSEVLCIQNGTHIIGGSYGSTSWIKIGGNAGEHTELNILDNSVIDTENNSVICIRGYNANAKSWLNVPEDLGGTNVRLLDGSALIMRGVWDDSQELPGYKIPQGLEHPNRKQDTTLFEMTDNAEFRMWGDTKIKFEDAGFTLKDNSVNSDYSFTVNQLKTAIINGGASVQAGDVSYNNTSSGLIADNVQAAIDKVVTSIPVIPSTYSAASITYTNTTSGLVATNIQDAVDELAQGSSYSLPTASSSTLGGIKVGSGLAIDANGVLSVNIPTVGNTGF